MADLMSILSTRRSRSASSNVDGFRAQVKYQSEGTSQYQQVLIKDFSFRFGNTKVTLTNVGKAEIKNVVTDPATGRLSRHGPGYAEQVIRRCDP